jgi:hypothetical protein
LGQFLQRCRRGAKQQVVHQLLIAASQLSQRLRQREGDHEIRDRQQSALLLRQSLLPGPVLALGTVPVLAGVVTVMDLVTMLTVAQMTPQRRRPALFDIGHGPPVTGQHPIPIFGSIGLAVLPKYLGQATHGKSAINSLMT